MHLTTIVVKDGYDGQPYRIDAPDEDMARDWLYALVAELRDSSRPGAGLYCPLTVETFATRKVA